MFISTMRLYGIDTACSKGAETIALFIATGIHHQLPKPQVHGISNTQWWFFMHDMPMLQYLHSYCFSQHLGLLQVGQFITRYLPMLELQHRYHASFFYLQICFNVDLLLQSWFTLLYQLCCCNMGTTHCCHFHRDVLGSRPCYMFQLYFAGKGKSV